VVTLGDAVFRAPMETAVNLAMDGRPLLRVYLKIAPFALRTRSLS
jgi:hypothetical protein